MKNIKRVIKNILTIQLNDNVKARILDNDLSNEYVRTDEKKVRSQIDTYNYLLSISQHEKKSIQEVKETPAAEVPGVLST